MAKKKHTSAALEYVHRRFFAGKPERLAQLEEARASAQVARKVYELRTKGRCDAKDHDRVPATRRATARPRMRADGLS